jgi:hypothetical protein
MTSDFVTEVISEFANIIPMAEFYILFRLLNFCPISLKMWIIHWVVSKINGKNYAFKVCISLYKRPSSQARQSRNSTRDSR